MPPKGYDIVDHVLTRLVKDSSFDEDWVIDIINQGLVEIAGEVLLPALDTFDSVTTDPSAWGVDLPADFQRSLYMAQNKYGDEIQVYQSKAELIRRVGPLTQVGDIYGVSAIGDTLYYANSPASAEDIAIHYYRVPATITIASEPDCFDVNTLPDGMSCVEYYTAFSLWEIIEAGEEGNKANTNRFQALYENAKRSLSVKARRGGISTPRKANPVLYR